MNDLVAFANLLADEAGNVIRGYFRQPFTIEHKSKEQPVTVADRACEARLRELIEAKFPDDGIFGEEYGVKPSKNGRDWVLDPIDGTKSFIIGRPTFGTLIALCEEGVPVLGVIDQPINRERWIGAKGLPTTLNGKPVRTRECLDLSLACACSTTSYVFPPFLAERLEEETNFMVWGGDCYGYGLVASGSLDIHVEGAMKPYDFAAAVPIVQGAGGIMCDWQGKALTLASGEYTIALGDERLKDQMLEMLNTTLAAAA